MTSPRSSRQRRRRSAAVLAAVVATAVVGAAVATGFLPGGETDRAGTAGDRPAQCSVAALTAGWSVGTLQFEARSVDTGATLAARSADVPAATGSTMKVLTMAAAVAALGPDTTIPTRVVQGSRVDTVVVVGGGDPTLSRLPTGQDSVYPDAPHLDDLARQVLAARAADRTLAATPIRHLEVDASMFDGPAWQQTWSDSARTSGSVGNVTALMVDGDRDDPTAAYSLRSTAAVSRASTALAPLLGSSVAVDAALVTAPAGARQLGVVRSAPVADLARYTLTHSDDTLAETLARLVAVHEGTGGGFTGIQAGTMRALAAYRVPTTGLRLVDGSGLSPDDRVTPAYMTALMVEIGRRSHDLGAVYDGLAIAGRTGTLAEDGRFRTRNTAARGHIRGKTGTLDDMFGLTGVTDRVNGTGVAFTIWAEGVAPGTDPARARNRIDRLATAVWRCGGALRP